MSRLERDAWQPNLGLHADIVEDADDEIWPDARTRSLRTSSYGAAEPAGEATFSSRKSLEILHSLVQELEQLRLRCSELETDRSETSIRHEQDVQQLTEEIRQWRDLSNRLLQRLKSADQVMQDAARFIAVTNARSEEANTSALDASHRLFLIEKFLISLQYNKVAK